MTRFTLFIVMLTAMTTAFSAGEMNKDQEMRFNKLDTDANGYISQAEVKDKHRVFYYYQRADKNSDGHLDTSEFSAFEIEVPAYPASTGQ